jgi:hypothetical protein
VQDPALKNNGFSNTLNGTPNLPSSIAFTDSILVPGHRLAQVRLIFRLPEEYGLFTEPLLYVHWFKPLRPAVEPLGMHHVSFSSHNHRQRASIIPASHVIRSVHLIPNFGRAVDWTWSSDTIFDNSASFYLNPYLRHYDFYHLRYIPDRQKLRNRPRAELARERHLRTLQEIVLSRPRR